MSLVLVSPSQEIALNVLVIFFFNNFPKINLKKLSVKFGNITIVEGGKLNQSYDEKHTANYMKRENIEINIETFTGKKNFTAYTMDLTKKYIEINADYRS